MSEASPLVSVLVPVYNVAAYLPELIRSLRAQTFKNFEVLILDDGSTDAIGSVLSSFEKADRFRVFRWKTNRGLNTALRELLGLMRGDFWVSPGADDVLLPEFLERRAALFQKHPEAAIVHGAPEFIDEAGEKIPSPYPKLDLPEQLEGGRALRVLLQHNIINQPSALVRSSVTQAVLPFFECDWKYAPDWHLWILHVARGGSMIWDPRGLHKYRVHRHSLSLDPAKSSVRRAETALVPLCALSAAATFSEPANVQWRQWRRALYARWLRRALKLRREGLLDDSWLAPAAKAINKTAPDKISLFGEAIKYSPAIAWTALKERIARSRQTFGVAGLAQIDDPIFR